MGMRFVIGRAGSGKSSLCLEEIRSRLRQSPEGHPLFLLVPEQATFQAELALVSTPGVRGLIRAQVLSFRRLGWRVMQDTGGTAGTPIDDLGKKMLLHKLLHKYNGELRLFRQAYDKTGFVDQLHRLVGEWKRHNLTPDDLEGHYRHMGAKLPDAAAALGNKLHDLILVYRQFEAELAREYLDGDSFLTRLAEHAGECGWLRDAEVWVDGFNSFTPQERSAVAALAEHCRQVTLTLTLDRPYLAGEHPGELDLFHPPATAMRKLREALEERRLPDAQVQILGGSPPRFAHSSMLAHLERQYEHRLSSARRAYEPAPSEAPQVFVRAVVNRRAEVEAAARQMIALVRDMGYRWQDMVLRLRSLEEYADLLETVFSEYRIPYFMDHKRQVLHHPLVELIRSALEAVNGYWPYEAVFRCVKTGFFLPLAGVVEAPLQEEWDIFENYVLMYGIHGRRFLDERSWRLRKLAPLEDTIPEAGDEAGADRAAGTAVARQTGEGEPEAQTGEGGPERQTGEGSAELLPEEGNAEPQAEETPSDPSIAACAHYVIDPLVRLQKRLSQAGGAAEMAEALFLLLEELHVPERLEAWTVEAVAEGRPEKGREHSQMWELIMDILDQLAGLMENDPMKPELFARLVETGLDSLRMGLVPPAVDQVLVGTMDRTRSSQVKAVFVLGANDGMLPQKANDDGIIAENEREFLLEQGVPMADSGRRKLLDEQFLIYTVLAAPSHLLYLSYALADEDGKTLLPSEVIKQAGWLLPTVKPVLAEARPHPAMPDSGQLEFVAAPGKAVADAVAQLREAKAGKNISPVWLLAYNWLIGRPEWRERLGASSRALFYFNREEPLSADTSLLLFGDHLRASVSRMERFAACPFSHFAAYGLRLRERRIYRLEAPDIGQLYHAALSGFARQLSAEQLEWGQLTDEEIVLRVNGLVDFLSPRLQNEILSSTSRYKYMAHRLKGILSKTSIALAEHARRGAFVPVGLEVGFGPGEELPSLVLPLPGGQAMELVGRIDRVDRAYSDKGMLLRIMDYKSSPTMLRLPEVYHGLSLQMLTYLDVVLTHAPLWLGEPAHPAGVLYFHVHNPLLSCRNRPDPEEAMAAARKQYKTRGLITADAETVFLMDKSLKEKGGYSDLIPVAMKTDGTFYKSASVATEGGWERLRTHVRGAVKQIGKDILGGRVEAEPYRLGKKTACAFCPYRPVCSFDPQLAGNRERAMRQYGKNDIWLALQETAPGDGEERNRRREP